MQKKYKIIYELYIIKNKNISFYQKKLKLSNDVIRINCKVERMVIHSEPTKVDDISIRRHIST